LCVIFVLINLKVQKFALDLPGVNLIILKSLFNKYTNFENDINELVRLYRMSCLNSDKHTKKKVGRRMEKSEFLLTARGAYSRYIYGKRKRSLFFEIQSEPLSKKSMRQKYRERAQEEIIEKLKNLKKRGFISSTNVCLRMSISTNHKTPPHIHTIPKNYIDLLWKFYSKKIKRKKILFEDDKQIKYLSVRYNIGLGNSGIHFTLYPFNMFINDIRLAYSFIEGDFGKIDRFSYRISSIDDGYEKEREKFYESVEEFDRLAENRDAFDDETFELFKRIFYKSAQEHFLKTQNLSVGDLYWLFCKGMDYSQSLYGNRINSNYSGIDKILQRDIVLSPLNILFPSVPTEEGASVEFINTIKQKMIEYKDKNRFMNPLLTPVSIKVIFKPPVTKNEFHKDLDNIMRIIVPAFHEIFKPPVSSLQSVNLESLEGNMRVRYEEMLKRIPKSVQHQIAGYEIFQIPRENGDDSDGLLSLVIADGFSRDAYTLIEKTINEYYDAIED